jgi:hypothetical protein
MSKKAHSGEGRLTSLPATDEFDYRYNVHSSRFYFAAHEGLFDIYTSDPEYCEGEIVWSASGFSLPDAIAACDRGDY